MRTFQSTSSNGFALSTAGNLTLVRGLEAITTVAVQYMQARRGEMFLAADRGIPFDPVAWSGSPNVAQFEAAGRATLLQVPDVVQVLSFQALLVGDVLNYTADILTTAGAATINGNL
jgi:hypothetical protein